MPELPDKMPELEPGMYLGYPEDDYHRLPYASKSTMWRLNDLLEVCYDHATWKLEFEKPYSKDAFGLGSYVDDLLTQGEDAEEKYEEFFETISRGVAFRAAQRLTDKILIPRSEAVDGRAMVRSIQANPIGREVFEGDGSNQVTIVWDDIKTGVRCKARMDRLTGLADPQSGDEFSTVVDLKTMQGNAVFFNEAIKYGYYVQHAHYRAGLEALDILAGRPAPYRRFVFLVVTKSKHANTDMHKVELFEFDEADMDNAMMIRDQLLVQFKQYIDGEFPDKPRFIKTLRLPGYEVAKYGESVL